MSPKRRVWVRHSNGPPTSIILSSSDLIIDDLKSLILAKYPTSLGRTCDCADLVVRLPNHLHVHHLSGSGGHHNNNNHKTTTGSIKGNTHSLHNQQQQSHHHHHHSTPQTSTTHSPHGSLRRTRSLKPSNHKTTASSVGHHTDTDTDENGVNHATHDHILAETSHNNAVHSKTVTNALHGLNLKNGDNKHQSPRLGPSEGRSFSTQVSPITTPAATSSSTYSRQHSIDRALAPDTLITDILDQYFSHGMKAEDAFIVYSREPDWVEAAAAAAGGGGGGEVFSGQQLQQQQQQHYGIIDPPTVGGLHNPNFPAEPTDYFTKPPAGQPHVQSPIVRYTASPVNGFSHHSSPHNRSRSNGGGSGGSGVGNGNSNNTNGTVLLLTRDQSAEDAVSSINSSAGINMPLASGPANGTTTTTTSPLNLGLSPTTTTVTYRRRKSSASNSANETTSLPLNTLNRTMSNTSRNSTEQVKPDDTKETGSGSVGGASNTGDRASENKSVDKSSKTDPDHPASTSDDELSSTVNPVSMSSILEGVVPPINVLIVEDNIINQKILEAFMKKRKIRSEVAKNGKEALDKWRKGGFHLVFMDLQLPVMSGIEATKEIRRLEHVNRIGMFPGESSTNTNKVIPEEDVLPIRSFRSPIIIVALTASSLQSDRQEAIDAGCNDFLTKPVSLVWLERKIAEWGCMQALIDFEGWWKWKVGESFEAFDGKSTVTASVSQQKQRASRTAGIGKRKGAGIKGGNTLRLSKLKKKIATTSSSNKNSTKDSSSAGISPENGIKVN